MSPLFVDASGWIAILNADDVDHEKAVAVWRSALAAKRPVVTTDWVLVEVGNALAKPRTRHPPPALYDRLVADPLTTLVEPDHGLVTRAWALYRERRDKAWGLTDCLSFVVMADASMTEAFTADRHFEQAGFRKLL